LNRGLSSNRSRVGSASEGRVAVPSARRRKRRTRALFS
jgi:hypothetical protein